ncbi:hypothetical protein ABZX40_07100 [Streptomyces sp. NPDC004610]|uniref:hypothetical protein n=1 Tax=unclassified Streptomyces TaxID=2593676 RepID=UPI0033BA485A
MRRLLDEAQWSPDGEPEQVLLILRNLSDGIGGLVCDESGRVDTDLAKAVFSADPLGDIYVFASGLRKSVDQRHPAQGDAGHALAREAFVQQACGSFPYFHRLQRELSESLDQIFPRS